MLPDSISRYLLMSLVTLGIMSMTFLVQAQADRAQALIEDAQVRHTIETLGSLIKLQSELKNDIKTLTRLLESAQSAAEKKEIQQQLDKLGVDLETTSRNLKVIAAGADIASLGAQEETEFNFQKEVFSLLRPALKEMRDITSHVRLKSDLKEKIAYYQEKLPIAELAVTNISELLAENEDESLEQQLIAILADWQKQLTFIQSELRSAELQLDKWSARRFQLPRHRKVT